ncbi:MAG: glycosyltransferase family 2 protein, partial [Proteobacteria bacterium]|nr:glycosyltransferase family 2 protein [Pseudomonadota bacterium]
MRAPVSVCIIACNEEELLPRCLDSVAWADEIVVVVDEKSRDGTEKIARERAQCVIVRPYLGDIEQKEFCAGLASHDWVLALDPDEVLPPATVRELEESLASADEVLSGIEVNRATFYLGRWVRHGDFYPDWKLRVFRRSRARFTGRNPHARIEVEGEVHRLAGVLEHRSYRDLADQIERIQFFSEQAARALHEEGRRARVRDLV